MLRGGSPKCGVLAEGLMEAPSRESDTGVC